MLACRCPSIGHVLQFLSVRGGQGHVQVSQGQVGYLSALIELAATRRSTLCCRCEAFRNGMLTFGFKQEFEVVKGG